ncbi:MAG: hypothetical protein K6E47_15095 [Lachnospiraceae bacterium]|nr:hypothetical protein [Lachnospiraceae bacterium]
MKIPVFGLVMIFVIWLSYEIKKHTKADKQDSKDFWERERKSGFVPRKSTAGINYITLDESFLPKDRGDSGSELNSLCNRILNFRDMKIADLSSMSNTELKETYGTANFTALSEADNNFTALVPLLNRLVEYLYDEGRLAEAEKAASFCVEKGVMTYPVVYTLALIYDTICATDKLEELVKTAEASGKCQERTLNDLHALMS